MGSAPFVAVAGLGTGWAPRSCSRISFASSSILKTSSAVVLNSEILQHEKKGVDHMARIFFLIFRVRIFSFPKKDGLPIITLYI